MDSIDFLYGLLKIMHLGGRQRSMFSLLLCCYFFWDLQLLCALQSFCHLSNGNNFDVLPVVEGSRMGKVTIKTVKH